MNPTKLRKFWLVQWRLDSFEGTCHCSLDWVKAAVLSGVHGVKKYVGFHNNSLRLKTQRWIGKPIMPIMFHDVHVIFCHIQLSVFEIDLVRILQCFFGATSQWHGCWSGGLQMRWISRIWASWRQNNFCSIDGIWDGNGKYGVTEVVLGICPCSPRIGIFKIRTLMIMDQTPMFFHACNCNSCVTCVGWIWYCLRWWCGGDPVRADRFWSSHSHGKLLRSQLLEEWGVKRPFLLPIVSNC